MKRLFMAVCTIGCLFCTVDTYAWGKKESKQAKAEARAEKKAEKQKTGIKDWRLTRYKFNEVNAAIEKNGKVTAEDIKVTCNVEEAQNMVDGLIAGYITVVNILEGYVEIEEGNAIAGLVAKKVEGGKSIDSALADLSAKEKSEYDKYLQWLKDGENAEKLSIEDEDLEKIMTLSSTFKEEWEKLKESIKSKKRSKVALAKDALTAAKIAGSTAKGGLMLKGIIDREKKAKKLLIKE